MSSGASVSDPKSTLPSWSRIAEVVRGLPKPAKILAGTTLVTALAVGAWSGLRSVYEPYGILFSQLEREDAGAVVNKLKELRVPYRIAAEGSAVEVPEARVAEVRLELASAGLPRGGGIGFEGFDNMRLGATEFEQRVLFRRAMEGELARTINGLDAIRSARVHLVLPEKSVFAARREQASASVIVRLRPGRTLGASEVGGVVHLVAAAVPGLTSDHVALVTTEGIALHRPRTASSRGGAVDEVLAPEVPPARALESNLEERARALLERLLGPGHVDVRVSAEMDLSRVERTEDRYDPTGAVLRSEEATVDRASASEDSVAGVPGAESNVPNNPADGQAPAPSAAPSAGPVVRETHTRNYELAHVQEKRVSTAGIVRRLTVAVVVDGVPGPDGRATTPRSAPELDKLTKLVKSAVGADDKRGDVVTVESIPFLDAEPPAAPEAPPASAMSRLPPKVRRYAPVAGGAVVALLIGGILLARRRRRRRAEPPAATPTALPPMEEAPALPEGSQLDQVREEAVRKAKLDPATAALVVRYWLGSAAEEEATHDAA